MKKSLTIDLLKTSVSVFATSLVLVYAAKAYEDNAKRSANIEPQKVDPLLLKGTNGAAGAQGVAGQDGAAGSNGVQGSAGAPGVQGNQGVPGIQGPTGNPGPQGAQGFQGDPGVQGIQGVQGVQGKGYDVVVQNTVTIGATGVKSFVAASLVNSAYKVGDYVRLTEFTYYYSMLGRIVSITATDINVMLDDYDGGLGLVANIWNLSLAGKKGIQGTQGPQGIQGIQGINAPRYDGFQVQSQIDLGNFTVFQTTGSDTTLMAYQVGDYVCLTDKTDNLKHAYGEILAVNIDGYLIAIDDYVGPIAYLGETWFINLSGRRGLDPNSIQMYSDNIDAINDAALPYKSVYAVAVGNFHQLFQKL